MPIELIVIIAALIISWLVFTAFINIVKTSVKTAVTIAAIVLVLQLVFGIGSGAIFGQVTDLPRIVWQFFFDR